MGIKDPRILSVILDDLVKQIQQWTTAANQTLKEAEYVQKNAKEQACRAYHDAAFAVTQAENDRQAVISKKNDVDGLISQTGEAVKASQKLREEVSDALDLAEKTLAHWKRELQAALEWLARAQAWLERAFNELARAQSERDSAQSALNYARARLQSCRSSYRTDSQGNRIYNDCSSEEAAVRRAQERLINAEAKVREAQIEVEKARDEVARAQAWVNRCKQAVAYAKEAVGYAEQADDSAKQAENSAERSREDAASADRFVKKAAEKADEEKKFADSMMRKARRAQNSESEAHNHLQNAINYLDSAYHLATRLKQELEYITDHLFEFDRPAL